MVEKDKTGKSRVWAVQSPEEPGFHAVITPESAACQHARIYRLNLLRGESYTLFDCELEMHPVLISGSAELSGQKSFPQNMNKLDAFYLAGGDTVEIRAKENCIFYIAAASYEGVGVSFFRAFDPTLPVGDIHQVHGTGVGRREVFMTLSDQDAASHLICGLTWGAGGAWTSWPPHQHEKDLEEVYCYFDMPLPHFGLHLSYLSPGDVDGIIAYPVHSGTMVQVPWGYHPTVAAPGTQNTYLWVLAARKASSRSYDLAVVDPQMESLQS